MIFELDLIFLSPTYQTAELSLPPVVLWGDEADLARIFRPNTVEMAETDNEIYCRALVIPSSGNSLYSYVKLMENDSTCDKYLLWFHRVE